MDHDPYLRRNDRPQSQRSSFRLRLSIFRGAIRREIRPHRNLHHRHADRLPSQNGRRSGAPPAKVDPLGIPTTRVKRRLAHRYRRRGKISHRNENPARQGRLRFGMDQHFQQVFHIFHPKFRQERRRVGKTALGSDCNRVESDLCRVGGQWAGSGELVEVKVCHPGRLWGWGAGGWVGLLAPGKRRFGAGEPFHCCDGVEGDVCRGGERGAAGLGLFSSAAGRSDEVGGVEEAVGAELWACTASGRSDGESHFSPIFPRFLHTGKLSLHHF